MALANTTGQGKGIAVIIQEFLLPFRESAIQVASFESLFLKIGLWEQLGLLLSYLPPCCVVDKIAQIHSKLELKHDAIL